jgi:hypothetical protein
MTNRPLPTKGTTMKTIAKLLTSIAVCFGLLTLAPQVARAQTYEGRLNRDFIQMCGRGLPGSQPCFAVPLRYFKPCAEEDQTTRCFWDAKARGNGLGRSFVIRKSGRKSWIPQIYADALTLHANFPTFS